MGNACNEGLKQAVEGNSMTGLYSIVSAIANDELLHCLLTKLYKFLTNLAKNQSHTKEKVF